MRHGASPRRTCRSASLLVSFRRTNSPRGYAFLFLREGDESPFRFAATFCKMFVLYQNLPFGCENQFGFRVFKPLRKPYEKGDFRNPPPCNPVLPLSKICWRIRKRGTPSLSRSQSLLLLRKLTKTTFPATRRPATPVLPLSKIC